MAKTPFPRPLRILLVDDYPDSSESLRRVLALHGHDVRTALDGPSALGGGFRRFLLGSVSSKLAHHAQCSLMIVREE